MLALVRPLVGLVGLRLTDGVGSVRKIIRKGLCRVGFLRFIPMNGDLSHILTGLYTLDFSGFNQTLLWGKGLPVHFVFRTSDIAADQHIVTGYVFDGHLDPVQISAAECL